MYKRCIFNLDGILINSIYAIWKSVNDTLSYWSMHEISVEESRFYVGDGYKKLLERSLVAYEDKELVHYGEAVDRHQDISRECYICRMEARKGVRELLEFLKPQDILIAVLSNRPRPRILDNAGGAFGKGYFNLIYDEREDRGTGKKPCSDGAWVTTKELGLSKSEIFYPGNTSTDMETGDNAKVDTVSVTWGFQTREKLMTFYLAPIADHPSWTIQYVKGTNGIE